MKKFELIIRLKLAFATIATLLGMNERDNCLNPVTLSEIDPVDIDLAETIELGAEEAESLAKHFRKATHESRRDVFALLHSLPHAIEDSDIGWKIFLLCLLAIVADLVVGPIQCVPIIMFTNLTTAPRALRMLIELFNPFRKLTGKRSRIRRPAVMEAVIPIGGMSVSTDLVDYCGGKIKVSGCDKLCVWLPFALVPVAIAANVPADVADALLAASPLALLVFCGKHKINNPRFVFRWDGTAFESADLELLELFKSRLPLAQAEILSFSEYIHAKKGRRERIVDGMADFFPTSHVGRFTKTLDADPEIRIWAAALSTLRELLRFAEKMDWCHHEVAQWVMLEAWQAVLPESAPTPPSENAVAVRADSVNVFWHFLEKLVRGNMHLITHTPRSDPHAIAEIHEFDGVNYLIFTRKRLVASYNVSLDQDGGAPISTANDGIALAHLLRENWGIHIRVESESDLSWRYAFYAKGNAPEGEKEKQPCIAIPFTALPNDLRAILSNGSDDGSSEGNPSPAARTIVEGRTEDLVN